MTDLTQMPLSELRHKCQEQRQLYKRSHGAIKEKYCDEIVQRACQHNPEALEILLGISGEIAAQRYPYPEEKDDFAQTVVLRLYERFRKTNDPLIFSGFAQYHAYLNTTIEHTRIGMAKSRWESYHQDSLDKLEEGQNVPFEWKYLDVHIDQQRFFDSCLSAISHPLQKEVFLRKYLHGETISEIVQDLQVVYTEINADQVYDLLANAMRRVRKISHKLVNQSEDKS